MTEAVKSAYPSEDPIRDQEQADATGQHEALLKTLEQQLKKATAKAEHEAERAAKLERQLERAQHDVVELSRAFIRETHLREAAQEDIARRDIEIADLRSSTSWRITKPLRGIRLVLGRRG